MASTLMTPGVYIEEKNAFPNAAVAVETAVPVFIGYTDIATQNGTSLLKKPVRISSFSEFTTFFGAGFKPKYKIEDAAADDKDPFMISNERKALKITDNNTFYLYNSIRLFYANGGGAAYIVSVGTYGDKPDGFEINMTDFIGSENEPGGAVALLNNEPEPTLVVIPDAIALGEACYTNVYQTVLQHCARMQNRFAILDLIKQPATGSTDEIVAGFREKIGYNALSYGAAYYPWLHTNVVQVDEISFENFDAGVDLEKVLPENDAKEAIARFKAMENPAENDKRNYHFSLKATSHTYVRLLNEILRKENELPPSGAMAGIFTMVDNSRGVWKAPANISLTMVTGPTLNLSNDSQERLNVDVISGKSINVIRPFPGIGTLVWGGRTLDGNSQDWRYINVRRSIIMLEQSIKSACRAYVFEPNDSNTWITVKSLIVNFLTNMWKQGALAGAAPDQAFDVQAGLGATMTPNDIIDGKMIISIKVAIVRPAEFIMITFVQQMQQS